MAAKIARRMKESRRLRLEQMLRELEIKRESVARRNEEGSSASKKNGPAAARAENSPDPPPRASSPKPARIDSTAPSLAARGRSADTEIVAEVYDRRRSRINDIRRSQRVCKHSRMSGRNRTAGQFRRPPKRLLADNRRRCRGANRKTRTNQEAVTRRRDTGRIHFMAAIGVEGSRNLLTLYTTAQTPLATGLYSCSQSGRKTGGSTMTLTLPGLIVLIVIAAMCGAVGKALGGGARGGLIVSIALGFIGALIGPWVAHQLKLSEPIVLRISGESCPIISWRFFTSCPGGGGAGAGTEWVRPCPLLCEAF
jgi:uncharacterized membrane protein YeaQ/YmgE (transglycosylase-associated protein family)